MLTTNTDEKKNLLPEYSQRASYPFPGILTRDPKLELKTYKSNQKTSKGTEKGLLRDRQVCTDRGQTFPQNICCTINPYLDQVFNSQWVTKFNTFDDPEKDCLFLM